MTTAVLDRSNSSTLRGAKQLCETKNAHPVRRRRHKYLNSNCSTEKREWRNKLRSSGASSKLPCERQVEPFRRSTKAVIIIRRKILSDTIFALPSGDRYDKSLRGPVFE
jgi:hypothetical protein